MGFLNIVRRSVQLQKVERMDLVHIKRLQTRKLKDLVRWAKEKSPFYAELYKEIDTIREDFSIRDLPIVTKSMLMRDFDGVVTDPAVTKADIMEFALHSENIGRKFKNTYVVMHTSGTTGAKGFFVFHDREWDIIRAIGMTRAIRIKYPWYKTLWMFLRFVMWPFSPLRIAVVAAVGGPYITFLLFLITPGIVRWLTRMRFISIMKPVNSIVEELNRYDPHVLHGYPSVLETLAQEQKRGRLNIRPGLVTSSSEPLSAKARELLNSVWGDNVFETYGTTECPMIANECMSHRGLHLNVDAFILEPVDESNLPLPLGQPSHHVLLTCLDNYTFPLIRYECSDVVTAHPDPCPCGISLPLFSVEGRTDDAFWLRSADGDYVVVPPIPFEVLFLEVEGISQYQMIQEGEREVRVRYTCAEGGRPSAVEQELRGKLDRFFAERGLGGLVRIQMDETQEMERSSGGKIRQIFSRVPPPFA